jgi:hypothetical protein
VIGEQMFLEGVEVRQQALDEARTQLAEVETQAALTDELADGDLLRAWPTPTCTVPDLIARWFSVAGVQSTTYDGCSAATSRAGLASRSPVPAK